MTGVKAYMTGKIKVKGDLLLAQRLEGVFESLGGREVSYFLFPFFDKDIYSYFFALKRAIEFVKTNEQALAAANKAKL